MKYPNVSALVPEGEHFDESAVNEGVWLTAAHLNHIEQSLGANNSAVAQLETQLQAANNTAAQLHEQLNARPTQESLDAANATIATLQEQVKTLGKQSSGKGTSLTPVGQEKTEGGEGKVITLNDAEHPVNQAASAWLNGKKNAQASKPKF